MVEVGSRSDLEKLSPKDLQKELKEILRKIPTAFGIPQRRESNLAEIIQLARLLTQSKGTKSSTEYILRKAARGFEMGIELPVDLQMQNPKFQQDFPRALLDDEQGLFAENPFRVEAKILKGAIYSCEENGRFITGWREEFRQRFNVAYESVVEI